MKYLVSVCLCFMLFVSATLLAQTEYKTHTVTDNETIEQIAETYGVTVVAIKEVNPTLKRRLRKNTIIVLPNVGASQVSEGTPTSFKKHRVRRKETLFSISKKYNVSIDAIKRYNKELYARQLSKGDRLQIPIFPKVVPSTEPLTPVVETTVSNSPKPISSDLTKLTSHTVQPKETRYGIARMYGITLQQLESINPQLGEGLSVGTIINVPAETLMESAIPEDGFVFYEVQPKEGFYRLKVKTGLTQEEIIALNPYAKEGLKDGMVLKIPTSAASALGAETLKRDLENFITNTSVKKIAILLPFRLNKATSDSIESKKETIKKDRLMSLSLDFYSGVLMATEFAKDKGISSQLKVFDTEYSGAKVRDRKSVV